MLAVDVGLRTGLAFFGGDGRLRRYRSAHFANRTVLRRGVRGLLGEESGLEWVVLEGGGTVADVWEAEVRRCGLDVRRVSAETWRNVLMLKREQRSGRQAKSTADGLAREVIEWSGAKRPVSLRHDVAEAILVGLWAAHDAGWVDELPRSFRCVPRP